MIGLRGRHPDPEVLKRVSNVLVHRGPDSLGTYIYQNIGFGFRRLAILELGHSGDQPMHSACGRYVVVFNGEIFNYLELREELGQKGHRFRTASDTEVLLAAFKEWGDDCVRRFNGMWAFLILDHHTGEIFGSRDRFGEKPLYFYRDNDWILFASEIKAIRDSGLARLHVNWSIVSEWATEDLLDHSDQTFFKEVTRITAGTSFRVSRDAVVRHFRYWSLDNDVATPGNNPIEEFFEIFRDAVKIRTRSDVPVGVMLSGGMDSTAISCVRHRIANDVGDVVNAPSKAFCFVDPQYDESVYLSATQRQTNSSMHYLQTNELELWSDFQKQLWYQDEPVHSATPVIGYALMRLAKQHQTTVLLGGQGADEILGGYYDYYPDHWLGMLSRGAISQLARNIQDYRKTHPIDVKQTAFHLVQSLAARNAQRSKFYRQWSCRRRLARIGEHRWYRGMVVSAARPRENDPPILDLKTSLRRSIEYTSLPLYLRIEDRNSMASSVEARLPFLDYRLVSFADKLDDSLKLKPPWNKWILRESMKGKIPENIRTRLDKFGFPIPIDRWFQEAWQAPMNELLNENEAVLSSCVNLREVRATLEAQKRGDANAGLKLFSVAQMAVWLRHCEQSGVAI